LNAPCWHGRRRHARGRPGVPRPRSLVAAVVASAAVVAALSGTPLDAGGCVGPTAAVRFCRAGGPARAGSTSLPRAGGGATVGHHTWLPPVFERPIGGVGGGGGRAVRSLRWGLASPVWSPVTGRRQTAASTFHSCTYVRTSSALRSEMPCLAMLPVPLFFHRSFLFALGFLLNDFCVCVASGRCGGPLLVFRASAAVSATGN